ncbi:hypothetical protein EB796_001144 [Bugula neritina]|uniref:Uncharacterized protein n=1 Tax=Bugula neritina TaxID=10212 RepID=A0A7J7KQT5_BUGNE|nr:hypothetical protein EB796_001144 [Bugula neritina]
MLQCVMYWHFTIDMLRLTARTIGLKNLAGTDSAAGKLSPQILASHYLGFECPQSSSVSKRNFNSSLSL